MLLICVILQICAAFPAIFILLALCLKVLGFAIVTDVNYQLCYLLVLGGGIAWYFLELSKGYI